MMKPTKKDSPSIRVGKNMNNKPAESYAKPHTMDGKSLKMGNIGYEVTMPTRENWTPLNGGVSIGHFNSVTSEGVETRGNGAAERGTKARGPMA
jgi:hypothetical protein